MPSQRKRGRPPLGKKAYCIRMSPTTFAVLMQMVKWADVPDLSILLDGFATNWLEKVDYSKSKNAQVQSHPDTYLVSAFDAKQGLDYLSSIIKIAPKGQCDESALLEVKHECERFLRVLDEAGR